MIIYRDEERIAKLKKRGQQISIIGFFLLLAGFVLVFLTVQYLILFQTLALVGGFGLTQYGLYLQHRYSRSPRPDEVLDTAVKSVARDGIMYHYVLPAPHVLLTPAGPIVFVLKYQTGVILADGDKWSQKGLGFRRFFGQEGLGKPTRDAESMVKSLAGYISKQAPEIDEVPIGAMIVFTSKNKDELDVKGSRIPAMHFSKVKGFLKQKGKGGPLPEAEYEALRAAFDEAAGDLFIGNEMELLPRLHWIKGRASNVYLWQDDAGLLLVDTGMPGDTKKIVAYIDEAGFRPADVMAILITHADADHAGGAAELSDRCQAPVYTSSATAELLVAGKSPKHLPRVVQFMTDHFMGYKPVAADRIQILEDGQSLLESDEWQIMATPGHCADHHSFCSPVHGVLFAGDALSTRGDRLQLSNRFITADQATARQSARRLLQLTPAVFACGHGRPMIDHNAEDVMMLGQKLRSVEEPERNGRPEGATGG